MVTMIRRQITIGKNGCSCSMPGVWQAVAHNKGAAVIYHSPKGCGHVTRDMELGVHYRSLARERFVAGQYKAPLIISDLQEEHAIFGGSEQLRKCIDHVVAKYKPQYILIANSCVAGVIGDDTEAIAAQAEAEWKIPIKSVASCGFLDGDYHGGFYHAGRALMEQFMSIQPKLENTVTVLGDRSGPNGADAQEIRRLLQYFDLQVHCHFPTHSSVEEIQQVSSSALSVLSGGTPQSYPWIRKLGIDLQEMFGVPFFDSDYPIGWQTTKKWLEKLGDFLNKKEQALLAIKEEEKRLAEQLEKIKQKLKGVRTVLCLGRSLLHFHPAWVLEFLNLAEVSLEGIVLLDSLNEQQKEEMKKELQKQTKASIFLQSEGEKVLSTVDIVVTTQELADYTKRQLFLPILPPAGVSGLLFLIQKFTRLVQRPGERGGIIYG